MAVNTGKRPADLAHLMNPNDETPFWITWEGQTNGYTMDTSSWVIPDGFEIIAAITDDVSDPDEDGETFTNSNGVMIRTTLTSGTHYIGNAITYLHTRFGQAGTIVTNQRGFNITVGEV